ncbi:uncharacterized protein LOC128392231 [Panonychus citri]|uniref:uncharacterized protein LOC128392231 n=1 Tax=Panonychus citri TaxID=50023 RepID=UPI0023075C63|nr:uncharacterized protein LOC128392231 [Panonychus citri]
MIKSIVFVILISNSFSLIHFDKQNIIMILDSIDSQDGDRQAKIIGDLQTCMDNLSKAIHIDDHCAKKVRHPMERKLRSATGSGLEIEQKEKCADQICSGRKDDPDCELYLSCLEKIEQLL